MYNVLFCIRIAFNSDKKALFKIHEDTLHIICNSLYIRWTLRRPKMADVNKYFLFCVQVFFLRHVFADLWIG